jgi:hypothetical protein
MKITTRQYTHLVWLFESPFPRYFNDEQTLNNFNKTQKVQDNLVEKGLVKIVKNDSWAWNFYLEKYNKGTEEHERTLKRKYEYCYQNTDKVWAYRQWMTHKEIASKKHPHPYIDRQREERGGSFEYPSLTEEGVVAVLRKFGLRSDSKLVPFVPVRHRNIKQAEDYHYVNDDDKWRIEWVETN